MDNFWKWLKKANARAIFFCLLAALMVVVGWWAWKLLTPIRVTQPNVSGTEQTLTPPSFGILAYLQAQQVAGTNRPAKLFAPAGGFIQSQSSIRNPEQRSSPAPAQPEKTPVKPDPTSEKLVTLTYRGMFVGGDGVPVALIADSKSKRAAFYTAGTTLFGLKLTTIEAESLMANAADQSSVILKRGVPQPFPESHHAD